MKRSAPLQRTPLRRDDGKARATVAVPRKRKCEHCKTPFSRTAAFQTWCSIDCGYEVAKARLEKKDHQAKTAERKRLKAERLVDQGRREAIKPRSQWLAQAKTAIQRFRRLEELAKGSGCMSCGRSQAEVQGTDGWKPGGAWDGGHFLGKGARPELALEPLNIWLQCKSCNAGSGKYARKGHTVNAAFRLNLIAHAGLELVEWLEGPHEPKHYTIDDLKEILATYRARVRELMRQTESGYAGAQPAEAEGSDVRN